MEKQLSSFTDLELASVVGQLYQQLITVQNNLMAVNDEVERRSKASSCTKEEQGNE
jgi:hypothetical protein